MMTEDTRTDSGSVEEAIIANAIGPKKVSGDAGSVEQHSLAEQLELERYLQSKRASQGPGPGIRLRKIRPDGTI